MKNKLSNISKKSKMIAATAFVLGLTAVSGGLAYAADTSVTTSSNNPMDSLVSAIATKFNLNSADVEVVVKNVMESERSVKEAQAKTNQATRLTQAVTDGKITQAQAGLITAKMSEMQASREANKDANQNLTQEERQTMMKAEKESIKEWATSNNIPMNFLQSGDHRGPRGGFGAPNPQ
jgi:hypothetical protein